ncbi:hypothetical protein [Limnoraphis robusta]|uniref:hypothetical protein n=1 Tax=Limnoraphis robusta TaxID=1118279 RepID=UPI002B1EACC9|nr:hypothetical protein [Limnoraphis robusta]MEA5498028.1 hypothetical protein [Limnoraphis robusta BA-68 BA1]
MLRDILPTIPLLAFLWNQPTVQPEAVQPNTLPNNPTIEQVEQDNSIRHKINCSVISLDDVKVSEKETVGAGQLLCDRTEQRQALENKKQQLELSLSQRPSIQTTTEQLTLPPADFSVYEASIIAARSELARLENLRPIETLHYDEHLAMLAEPERWNAQQQQQEEISKARYELAEAISDLNEAKMERQDQEFRWLSQQQRQQQDLIISQQQSEQQWNFQKTMILNSIQEIEEKLEEVVAVKSPYSGSVRRVKVVSQNERIINVELTIIGER